MHDQSSTKRCSACGEENPLDSFELRSDAPDGHRGQCRECLNAKRRADPRRKQRDRDRAKTPKRKAESKRRYQRDRKRVIEKQRAYYLANRESRLSYLKDYRRRNKQELAVKSKRYRSKRKSYLQRKARERQAVNPEIYRNVRRQRKARLRGASGRHTAEDVRAKYEQQRGLCYWCSVSLSGVYEVDHIVPISKGGGNGPGNICCSCPPCNWSKGPKMPWEFAGRLF